MSGITPLTGEHPPQCNRCGKTVYAYISHVVRGTPNTLMYEEYDQIRVSPCQWCMETSKFEGMIQLLKNLVDESER